MAVWRRQPKHTVMVHSDQGSQFSSYDWCDFLVEHNLQQSMSRRGNCHDNAVAESFFQLLERERIRRKNYGCLADYNMEAQGDLLADYFVLKFLRKPGAMRQQRYRDSLALFERVLASFLADQGDPGNLRRGPARWLSTRIGAAWP